MRERILDAAEQVFAQNGFAGATIRDIAAVAKTQVGLVHHHGGGKEALFRQTVRRRAEELGEARQIALAEAKAAGALALPDILRAFFGPYLLLAETGPQWRAYARLVAYVSTDPRWRDLAAECFDPTAQMFLNEIATCLPGRARGQIAAGFVFAVSAMLACVTASWRVSALSAAPEPSAADQLEFMVNYCAAGFLAVPDASRS
ncbi:TetR/AcrR family transcriptional regulator [Aquicoccus sp. G2-2]|uniref:TetR/AcrR family transcriptional regulator n=1 Tax=Aquicoccus sp. G2-2 TaxID=3092120 RepID=UPI002AE0617D|nr:TetR/AcrR family transcriptional regulator [Aquicoccus sp. G2-2]MEA1112252.1 TetR/AcrR family transcriptional regulator [Aquicoccus sp. G2-2]